MLCTYTRASDRTVPAYLDIHKLLLTTNCILRMPLFHPWASNNNMSRTGKLRYANLLMAGKIVFENVANFFGRQMMIEAFRIN